MMKILFVEDDELVLASSAEMMRDLGYTVLPARSAEEALHILRHTPVEVLVTDVGLPGFSGDVLAAEARSLQPDLRIVFATGKEYIRDSGEGGAGPVLLRKPYDSEAIAAALQMLVAS